jgi:uncharacterized membrane protein YkoI
MKPKSKTSAAPAKPRPIKKKDVTLEEARKQALRKVKGTVEKEELRTEKGKPVYEFEIRASNGKTRDVWVSQRTGKVVRNSSEKTK